MSERVLALIPALNAAGTIAPVIAGVQAQSLPVLVIDDGSTDGTAAIAQGAGATVISHEVNRGKGAALKTGFRHAIENGYDAVITLDADGQHLPAEIPKFLAAYREQGADLIIGGRAHLFAQMLPRRRFANRISSWLIGRASRTNVTDTQSGYRLYSTRMLRDLHLHSDGFDMESEVIIRAGMRRLRVISIPINLGFVDGLSTSHYKPLADSLRIFKTAVKARFFWR